MNVQENNGNILTGRGQVQSQSEQAQSHGQAPSSSTSMAVQMFKNKNKPREEIKPVDKERQKVELEKSLESIKSFNQINEEIKETFDKHNAKLKQREEDKRESLRKAEAKYYSDLDPRSGYTNKDLGYDKDKNKDKDVDSDKDKDSDLDSFHDFV